MKRAGVAVNTAVLATAIRIDAGFETDVGAVIVRDDCAGPVAQELCPRKRVFLRIPIGIGFDVNFLEAIRRI